MTTARHLAGIRTGYLWNWKRVALLVCRIGYGLEDEGTLIPVMAKAVPLQAWTGPKSSKKLRLPDIVTTAQDGGRLSALRTGRLYPRKYSWYSFQLEAESTPGP